MDIGKMEMFGINLNEFKMVKNFYVKIDFPLKAKGINSVV